MACHFGDVQQNTSREIPICIEKRERERESAPHIERGWHPGPLGTDQDWAWATGRNRQGRTQPIEEYEEEERETARVFSYRMVNAWI